MTKRQKLINMLSLVEDPSYDRNEISLPFSEVRDLYTKKIGLYESLENQLRLEDDEPVLMLYTISKNCHRGGYDVHNRTSLPIPEHLLDTCISATRIHLVGQFTLAISNEENRREELEKMNALAKKYGFAISEEEKKDA